ncbi:MFS transporter [Actinosynnema sp. NPDC047251]|uniref:Permease, MFS-type n=1 Tax=Saccharothrix espanaensis (strain ATCC 51144 / DSM 44229 / JCM 9112 / NBRC 15066 / NRRL 15764) TaxID=1179773 RepID=K0KAX4_SACES|nr:MFS transporter [Saccharothrix espanaensis]CCH34662.1 Permease, MFS-type [Saccharothrix espanaensis DSM 44229]
MPIYPLYALLFADNGMSDGQISALFAIWSTVAVVAEIPFGALADRFSRRWSLVAAGGLQAAGYALWTAVPGFWSYAAGFVLWGLGGALVSGAMEALLHDALTAVGAGEEFGRLLGRVTAVGLLAQIPAALAATALFSTGGYALVGWVSVATCAGAGLLATRLPETPRGEPESYLATLRSGLVETAAVPAVRRAVLVVALLLGVDALEEYFPLLARDWDVPAALVPLAVLAIPLAGAAGAALNATRVPLVVSLALSALLLGGAGLLHHPAGLALVALSYGLYRMVLVVAETRLQERITGSARATVTSVAGLGSEVAAYGVYAAWVVGGVSLLSLGILAIALLLPWALRSRVPARR